MNLRLDPHLEIAIGTVFLAVGLAGPPLEPLRILLSLLLAVMVWRAGKFVGALSLLAVVAGGFAQHEHFRIAVLIGAAAIGVTAHFFHKRPRVATIVMAVSAVAGTAYLFLG
jgi:hypothetical protein